MRLRIDGQKVERFRVSAGLLKYEFAAKAGVHPNQLSRIAAGEAVGVKTARQIAGAMGLAVQEITAALVEAPAAAEPAAAGAG